MRKYYSKIKIASFLVLVFQFFLTNIAFASSSVGFNKCINIAHALEAPTAGEWGVDIEKDVSFEGISKAGFDSIRLPVRWDTHLDSANTIDPKYMQKVKGVVDRALDSNLKVILDVHHFTPLNENANDENIKKFYDIWQQISTTFSSYSNDTLYFELLNEPINDVTTSVWNRMFRHALSIIREDNPNRKILIGGTTYNTPESLDYLDMSGLDTTNLIGTFHFYLPVDFTHYDSDTDDKIGSFTSVDKTGAIARFMNAKKWGLKHNIPLVLGEFGVSKSVPEKDRAKWIKFISGLSNSINASWCVWSLSDDFSIYNRKTNEFDTEMLNSLDM